jgi:hypothetical protein
MRVPSHNCDVKSFGLRSRVEGKASGGAEPCSHRRKLLNFDRDFSGDRQNMIGSGRKSLGKLRSGFSVLGPHVESKVRIVLVEPPLALPHGQQCAGGDQHDTGKQWASW